MSDSAEGTGGQEPSRGQRPAGWSDADLALERRLGADELRLGRGEGRLAQDEARLAQDERWLRRALRLEIAVGVLLLLTIGALAMSWYALNRDIEAVAKADPKSDSVGTGAIRDGAVTRDKLAPGAVGGAVIARGGVERGALDAGAVDGAALADDSIGPAKLRDGAVTGRSVRDNGITGAHVAESTLGTVPRAAVANDATSLGGIPAARYVTTATVVTAESSRSTLRVKGPLTATCPPGTTVIAGGGEVEGQVRGVALTTSAPGGTRGWVATAGAAETPTSPWRLIVTAVCTRGG